MTDTTHRVRAMLMALFVLVAGTVGVIAFGTTVLAQSEATLDTSTNWANGNDFSGQTLWFTLQAFSTGTFQCTFSASAARAAGVDPQSVEVTGSDRLSMSLTSAGDLEMTIQSGPEEQVKATFYGNLDGANSVTGVSYSRESCSASQGSAAMDVIQAQQASFDIIETGVKDTDETHVHSDDASLRNGSTLTQTIDLDLVVPDDGDADGDTYNVTIDTQESLESGINVTGAAVETDPSGADAQVEVVGSPTVTDSENVILTIREGSTDRDNGNLSRETISIALDLDATQSGGSFQPNATVTHVITDDVGNETANVSYQTEATALTADAGADRTVNVSESFILDGSGSSADGTIVNYEWDVDADGTFEITGETATHSFSTAGDHTVTLRVTDDAGNTDTDTVTISVEDTTAPVADAGQNRTVNVSETFTLDGSASTDNVGITAYDWDTDDDGSTELTGETVTHSYDSPGEQTVTLTVSDGAGNSAIDTVTITVEDRTPPTADAGANRTVAVDEQFVLNASGSTDNVGITSYDWDVDADGDYELSGETVTHSYATAGPRTVTLQVTDAAGNEATDTVRVTVETGVGLPDVNGNGAPATDPDGDGVYEDVDGSGDFTIVDVQLLFTKRSSDPVQNNPGLFDFTGNGAFSIADVQQLFVDFTTSG